MTIACEFSDKGFLGKNIKGRREFSRMMERIGSGEDSIILYLYLSCLVLDEMLLIYLIQIKQDYGVILNTLTEHLIRT